MIYTWSWMAKKKKKWVQSIVTDLYTWRHVHPYIHCRIFQLPMWISAHYKVVFLPSAGPHCWSFLHTAAWLILQQSQVTWPYKRATPQNKHRNYYWPLKITPLQHKRPLQVQTEHRWFPVVCDHLVIGPHWIQLSNQTKQLLKAST